MKKWIGMILLLIPAVFINAQKYKINIRAGGNTTLIPPFENATAYVKDFLVPGFYTLNSGNRISVYANETHIQLKPGFFADVAVEKILKNNWTLSLSLGVNPISYTYSGLVSTPNVVTAPSGGTSWGPVDLKSIDPDYGNTKMLYLTSRAGNFSKKWDRFAITAGPQINYLISKQYTNRILLDTDPLKEGYEDGIFEARGDAKKMLVGATLSAQYHITPRFYISAGGQKIFSSLYQKEGTGEDVRKKSRPIQLELGIGYQITNL